MKNTFDIDFNFEAFISDAGMSSFDEKYFNELLSSLTNQQLMEMYESLIAKEKELSSFNADTLNCIKKELNRRVNNG